MSELVGRAKFAPPPPPRVRIERAHIVDTLDLSSEVPLTIVSGPPGCGKTVALSSWLARRPELRAVWMSCDERDVDPVVFWTNLTQGLQMAWPDAWLDVRDLLQGDQPSLQEVALSAVKELEALDEAVTIVIDDFHLARAASGSMSLVVEALPSTVRLVIGTRSDPQLPLHRMRLHRELLEVRAEELRLSLDETAALVAALGVELDDDSAQALYERSEGWVAAVHLAAMSLRGRDDPQAFLRSFSGENRLIAEFLVYEVLERHSELARRFLRESSVLDEMDAAACTAVTGIPDSDKLLRDLSAENMLVVPLGDGMSYRYHRLFRDLLRYQLRAGSAERWLELQQAAAKWFEVRGELDRAARHLTLAGDDNAAFALLHEHAVEVHVRDGTLALQRFVTALDLRRAEVDASRAVDIATALAFAGAGTDASLWISRAGAMRGELSDVDRARLVVARGMAAIDSCEPEECNAALAELPTQTASNDAVVDGIPGMSLRSTLWVGDFAGSHAAFDAAARNGRTPLEFREVMMTSGLSWTMCVEGHLREADTLAETALARAEQFAVGIHPMLSDALRTRGRVLYERGQIDAAESLLERAIAMAERVRPPAVLLSAIALARLLTVEGRFAEASASIDHARSCLRPGSRNALAALVDACDARLALATGEDRRAESLIETLEPSDLRSRLGAAVHFADAKPDAALELLERTHPATHRQVVDTQVLRTRIAHALGDDGADDTLAVTVELAREEQFVLALVDGMPELADRVSYILRSGPLHDFERRVLERIDRPKASPAHSGPVDLVEQLTAREATVLRYLDSRLTVHEIAAELFVSPNTLRTHVKAVYRKLGVSSRREAISEGRRLQLLAVAGH